MKIRPEHVRECNFFFQKYTFQFLKVVLTRLGNWRADWENNVICHLSGLVNKVHSYIPGVSIYSKDFPASCLIAPDNDSYWYDECQDKDCGFEYVYPFPTDDDLKTKCAMWLKWEDVNGQTTKNEQSGTMFELYQHNETTVK